MVILKTKKELKIMCRAGQIAAGALEAVLKKAKPGVTTLALDKIAQDYIIKQGASPSFKEVSGYRHSICATPNEAVVHGIPTNYELKEGDVLGVDVGAYYRGFHSDTAKTILIGGKFAEEKKKFLLTGEKALKEAIKKAQVGNRIGDISATIQNIVEGEGFSVVRELVGHGVGRELHEDPLVPGFGKKGSGLVLKEGMVIAIEVIYNRGSKAIYLLSDGWTIVTRDKKVSGLFEQTVSITSNGPVVLTQV